MFFIEEFSEMFIIISLGQSAVTKVELEERMQNMSEEDPGTSAIKILCSISYGAISRH